MNKNLPRIITIAVIVFALVTAGLWYFTRATRERIAEEVKLTQQNQEQLADAGVIEDAQPTEEEFDSCLDEPVIYDNGYVHYPVDPKYGDLDFLGELFTAYNCEPNRSNELFGVTDGKYTLGSKIWLKEKPSQKLIDVLKNIGYSCVADVSDADCLEWELLDDSVSVDELMKLEQFYKDFKQDDCRYCG